MKDEAPERIWVYSHTGCDGFRRDLNPRHMDYDTA